MGLKRLLSLGRPAVIGMVHARALPGTPRNHLSLKDIIEQACGEAFILKEHRLDALIIENMHDIPYQRKNDLGPEISSSMAVICSRVRDLCPDMVLGVQVLAGANEEALAVAQAADFDFIRAEGYIYAHVADEGIIESCAGNLLRYRKKIGADDIGVLTDIKKKHSSHAITADVNLAETAKAAEFFLSDGLVVTGLSTGNPVNMADVSTVRGASSLPVLVGSGVTDHNVEDYLDVDGLIIGSHFKRNGDWRNELDEIRIKDFMKSFMDKISE